MMPSKPTPKAVLRHCSPSPGFLGPVHQNNRRTTECYGNAAIASINDASRPFGVMAFRLAISRISTRSLRQNPTSSRWGKAVGRGVAGKRAVAERGDRARRRVFVSALDGWMP
jgi:hypothetical protein